MSYLSIQRAATYSLVAHVVLLVLAVIFSRAIPKIRPIIYTVSLVQPAPPKQVAPPAPPVKEAAPERPQNRQKVAPKPPKPQNRQKVPPRKKPAPKPAGPSVEELKAQRLQDLQKKKELARQEETKRQREREHQERLERIRQQAAAKNAAARAATDKAEYDRVLGEYQNTIMYAIYEKWVYPDVPDVKKLQAQISITVLPSGSIKTNKFERPSGNRPFDRSCLKAISDLGTVPPPPYGKSIEFIVRFIPE